MFVRRLFAPAFGLFALAALIGCSGNSGSFATVSGVVTYNGNPVEGAKVTFHSTTEVSGGQQMSYAALTDSSGKYLLAAVGKDPGIPAGMYKVTVTKIEGKGANSPREGVDAGQLDAMASDGGGGSTGGPKNILPDEYARPASTKLSVTLEVGKNENKNFDLTGKK